MATTFGSWLQNQLNIRGMTQADLARASGLATSHVAYLVNDKRGVTAETCSQIAKAFRLTTIDVMIAAGLPVEKPKLSSEAQEIATRADKLPLEDKLLVLDFLRSIEGRRKK